MGWLYVPGSEDWNSGSMPPSRFWAGDSTLSAMSSGKATPRPSSWRGWRTRPWVKLLSGTTSAPSRARVTAARWISSQEDSPANRSLELGSDSGWMIRDGSGPRSRKWWATWNPVSCSWRTFAGSRRGHWKLSSGTWPTSGSMRNGTCWQQEMWVRPTRGNAGGSSRGARIWPTVTARDDQKSVEAHLAMKQRLGPGHTAITSLTVFVKAWPTPRASMNENRTTKNAPSHGNGHGKTLAGEAVRWASSHPDPTTTTDGVDGSKPVGLNPDFAEMLMGWPRGWTDCTRSATGSYRSWRRRHLSVLRDVLAWYSAHE